jgi:hypothetical protein
MWRCLYHRVVQDVGRDTEGGKTCKRKGGLVGLLSTSGPVQLGLGLAVGILAVLLARWLVTQATDLPDQQQQKQQD